MNRTCSINTRSLFQWNKALISRTYFLYQAKLRLILGQFIGMRRTLHSNLLIDAVNIDVDMGKKSSIN